MDPQATVPTSNLATDTHQQLSRCLTLLQPSSSDEEKFAALLLIPRILQPDDFRGVKTVFDAMDFGFLERMLRMGLAPTPHEQQPQEIPFRTFHSIAVHILSSFCGFDDLVGRPELVERVPALVGVLLADDETGTTEESLRCLARIIAGSGRALERIFDGSDSVSRIADVYVRSKRASEREVSLLVLDTCLKGLLHHHYQQDQTLETHHDTTTSPLDASRVQQTLWTAMEVILAPCFASDRTGLKFEVLRLCVQVLSSWQMVFKPSATTPPTWLAPLITGLMDTLRSRKLATTHRDTSLTLIANLVRLFGSSWIFSPPTPTPTPSSSKSTQASGTMDFSIFTPLLIHIVCAETRVLLDSVDPISVAEIDATKEAVRQQIKEEEKKRKEKRPNQVVVDGRDVAEAFEGKEGEGVGVFDEEDGEDDEEEVGMEAEGEDSSQGTRLLPPSSSPSDPEKENEARKENDGRCDHMLPICYEILEGVISHLANEEGEDEEAEQGKKEAKKNVGGGMTVERLLSVRNAMRETFLAVSEFLTERMANFEATGDWSQSFDTLPAGFSLRALSTWLAEETSIKEKELDAVVPVVVAACERRLTSLSIHPLEFLSPCLDTITTNPQPLRTFISRNGHASIIRYLLDHNLSKSSKQQDSSHLTGGDETEQEISVELYTSLLGVLLNVVVSEPAAVRSLREGSGRGRSVSAFVRMLRERGKGIARNVLAPTTTIATTSLSNAFATTTILALYFIRSFLLTISNPQNAEDGADEEALMRTAGMDMDDVSGVLDLALGLVARGSPIGRDGGAAEVVGGEEMVLLCMQVLSDCLTRSPLCAESALSSPNMLTLLTQIRHYSNHPANTSSSSASSPSASSPISSYFTSLHHLFASLVRNTRPPPPVWRQRYPHMPPRIVRLGMVAKEVGVTRGVLGGVGWGDLAGCFLE
ncbi:hypothetical protein HK102_014069 [Quaeritorhiza haematococci]|nr:hypothetical protein HK102_014069 [Quaeritorhiza haematococci]